MTVTAEKIMIGGAAGPLQAVVEAATDVGSRYAVVCHPHPLYGGTMDNKVVTTVARALRDTGMPTIRFNFRGVGSSEGTYDAGAGETLDGAAVAAYGAARWAGRRPVIAGFSFGSYVAWKLAQQLDVAHLVLIAPPLARFDFSATPAPSGPCLVVQGTADDVVETTSVVQWTQTLRPQPALVLMPEAGHFFHGRLTELHEAVFDAVRNG